jgi:hypothetical protein
VVATLVAGAAVSVVTFSAADSLQDTVSTQIGVDSG